MVFQDMCQLHMTRLLNLRFPLFYNFQATGNQHNILLSVDGIVAQSSWNVRYERFRRPYPVHDNA